MAEMTFTDAQKEAMFQMFQNLTVKATGVHSGRRIKSKNGKLGKIRFRKFMADHDISFPKDGLTETVSFGGVEFFNWITDPDYKMNNIANVDELRVCFGVYTNDFLDEEGFEDENIGRLTIFLWPYLDGRPATFVAGGGVREDIPAFNLGGLKP